MSANHLRLPHCSVYAGTLSGAVAVMAVLQQAAWVAVLIGAGRLMLARGCRRLVVQGG